MLLLASASTSGPLDFLLKVSPLVLCTTLLCFVLLSMASRQIGLLCARFQLPLISGFLLTGVLVGPHVLKLLSSTQLSHLRFIDDLSLAVIAFAAGNELYLKELRSRFRSIAFVTTGQVVAIFGLGTLGLYFISASLPFMSSMSPGGRIAVCLLMGSILIARSPSSAIAIVSELRAKGPFTQTLLGVTMITDVVVIILFAISFSCAGFLLAGKPFSLSFLGLMASELLISFVCGFLVGKLIQLIFTWRSHPYVQHCLILSLGYGVFLFAAYFRIFFHDTLHLSLHVEPLLICMIGSFYVTNYTSYRNDFMKLLHDISPVVYVAFFTLTGASLGLDVLVQVWPYALLIVSLRLVTIFIGSFVGGALAGDPALHNRLSWMTYVTQAGVGLGLAKQVASVFPSWGNAFATLVISVIVIDQLVGPPLFKWAVHRAGEAHTKAPLAVFDGVHDVTIFGLDGRSSAIARQLKQAGWQVRVVTCKPDESSTILDSMNIELIYLEEISEASLAALEMERDDAVVAMLSDDENYALCELIYEHYGIEPVVALVDDRELTERFHKLGVLVVVPDLAMVSLLAHLVRAPMGTSYLLEQGDGLDILDLDVRDPSLEGMSVRDLKLPSDVLVLSVFHKNHKLISHGHTRLHLGDRVTVFGSAESLEKVTLMFEVTT